MLGSCRCKHATSEFEYVYISISIKRIVCLSVCLCPSVSMHSQFSRYRAETLQVGRGRPGTGRGGVKNVGGAPGGYTYFNVVKARATQLVYSQKHKKIKNITLTSYQTTHRLQTLSSFIENFKFINQHTYLSVQ